MSSSRRVVSLLAAVVMLVGRASPASAATVSASRGGPDTLTTMYDASGVRVIQRINDRNDIISVRLYVLGGSRQLDDATQGIEALLTRTSAIDGQDALAAAGARSILYSGFDWTVTGFQTLRENLAGAWAAWAPGIVAPALSNAALSQARGELISDARRRYGDPDQRVHELAWGNAFAGHPYRFDPRGTVQSLGRLTEAELRAYAKEQMVRSRMLLVVVGNVDRDRLSALVEGSLGTLPAGSYSWTPPPPAPKRDPRIAFEDRHLPTNYILGYIIGPPPTDDQYFAFEVATNLLSGKLNDVIRTERSLSYAAYASFQEAAVPTAAVYATSPDPAKVYDLILEQLTWLQTLSQVPGWALLNYVDQFVLDQLAQDLTNDAQAQALARADLYFGDYRLADQYVEQLRRVKPSDIRKVAIDYMRVMQIGYLGSRSAMSF